MELTEKTKEQLKTHQSLIESRDYLEIWETLKNPQLNEAFLRLGYTPEDEVTDARLIAVYRYYLKSSIGASDDLIEKIIGRLKVERIS